MRSTRAPASYGCCLLRTRSQEGAPSVDEPTRDILEKALELGTIVVALTIADRERILCTLDEPADALAELRGVLIGEHEWRVHEGLV